MADLQRFAWLEQRHRAALLEATTRDLRQHKTELGNRQKPASVNDLLAALSRFYAWAADTERVARNPPSHLTDVTAQPLAPKGFPLSIADGSSDRESQADGRHDRDAPAQHRTAVDELITLTWHRVHLQARSGWIDDVGDGDKRRRRPLNAEVKPLEAIRSPTPVDDVGGAVFRANRGPNMARVIEYLVTGLDQSTIGWTWCASTPNEAVLERTQQPWTLTWTSVERGPSQKPSSSPAPAAEGHRSVVPM